MVMKNLGISIKDKIVARYAEKNTLENTIKSTDINVLLNRVKLNQKKKNVDQKNEKYSCLNKELGKLKLN